LTPFYESCAEYYHSDTKYDRKTIHRTKGLDFSRKPAPFKDYQADHPVSLTPFLPFNYLPFTRTPLPEAPIQPPYPWGLSEISQLLFFSYGVTAILDSPRSEQTLLRAAPSAGGLYPAEIYLAFRDLPFIPNGIYHYNGKEHSLLPLYEGDFMDRLSSYLYHHPTLSKTKALIFISGFFERSAWRYGERGYRRILLDTGHLIGNLSLMAKETRFVPFPLSGFNDHAFNSFLFLEDQKEVVLAAMPLLRPEDVTESCLSLPFYPSPLLPPYSPPQDPETGVLFRDLHRLSSLGADPPGVILNRRPDKTHIPAPESTHLPMGEPIILPGEAHDFKGQIPKTLLMRRSARQYSGAPVSLARMSEILKYGYQDIDPVEEGVVPSVPHFFQPNLFTSYIVVNSVTELIPGLYRFDPLAGTLTLLNRGYFAETVCEFVLGQDLGRDAAFVLIQVADLEHLVIQYGQRAYRTLHMDVGQIGERINLAAAHAGVGASGIGGFYDDEVTDFLGLPNTMAVLYITTVGAIPG